MGLEQVHSRACTPVNSTVLGTMLPLTSACLGHQNCPLELRDQVDSSASVVVERTKDSDPRPVAASLHYISPEFPLTDGIQRRLKLVRTIKHGVRLHSPPAKRQRQYLLRL